MTGAPAHGVGARTDLPIPTGLAVTAATLAVAVTVLAVGLAWPGRTRAAAQTGRPLPVALARVLDSGPLRGAARAAVLALAAFVTWVALAGPRLTVVNLAPYALYITFWVGLVPLSLLLGPVWRVVNPLRRLHRGLERLVGLPPGAGVRALPPALGWWPAAGWLAGFVWLELVYPDRADPRVVGAVLVGYAVANLVAAQVFGAEWFDRGDGFEAYSTLAGRLSPLGRRGDGRLVLRSPLAGLAALRGEPGLVAVVVVLIGSTAYDGVTRTRAWSEHVPSGDVALGTLGLAAAIALVAALYLAAARLAGLAAGAGAPAGLPGAFAASLVPVAVGYAVAHYASLLLFEGQKTFILASDPFRTGADYLGLTNRQIDFTAVSTTLISCVQVAAIVTGHVLGVVAAHRRAGALFSAAAFSARAARRCQWPLGGVMVAFTGAAVALLLGT